MKAAVYLGPKHIEVREVPLPEPGPEEVRVRVAYCGVCGTDVHISVYLHGIGGNDLSADPFGQLDRQACFPHRGRTCEYDQWFFHNSNDPMEFPFQF